MKRHERGPSGQQQGKRRRRRREAGGPCSWLLADLLLHLFLLWEALFIEPDASAVINCNKVAEEAQQGE